MPDHDDAVVLERAVPPEILTSESTKIWERRKQAHFTDTPPQEGNGKANGKPPPKPNNLVGLALSGGGVRSASFNLGVLQAFYESGLLRFVDYLASVSGGGYISCFFEKRVKELDNEPLYKAPTPQDAGHAKVAPNPALGLARDKSGQQPKAIKDLLSRGGYLNRPLAFWNQQIVGMVINNLSLFSLVFCQCTALAFFWRCLDYQGFREWLDHYLRVFGYQVLRLSEDMQDVLAVLGDDLFVAFLPAAVLLTLWAVMWALSFGLRQSFLIKRSASLMRVAAVFLGALCISRHWLLPLIAVAAYALWRALLRLRTFLPETQLRRWIQITSLGSQVLLIAGGAALLVGGAVVLGDGDIGLGVLGAIQVPPNVSLYVAILCLICALPLLRPWRILVSGQKPRGSVEGIIFRAASTGLLILLPLCVVYWMAREDISGHARFCIDRIADRNEKERWSELASILRTRGKTYTCEDYQKDLKNVGERHLTAKSIEKVSTSDSIKKLFKDPHTLTDMEIICQLENQQLDSSSMRDVAQLNTDREILNNQEPKITDPGGLLLEALGSKRNFPPIKNLKEMLLADPDAALGSTSKTRYPFVVKRREQFLMALDKVLDDKTLAKTLLTIQWPEKPNLENSELFDHQFGKWIKSIQENNATRAHKGLFTRAVDWWYSQPTGLDERNVDRLKTLVFKWLYIDGLGEKTKLHAEYAKELGKPPVYREMNLLLLALHYPDYIQPTPQLPKRVVVICADQNVRGRALLIGFGVLCVTGFLVNLNSTSLHRFYRKRLAEAYLNEQGERDDTCLLEELEPVTHKGAPYPLLAASVTLFPSLRERRGNVARARTGPFLLSPLYCGSPVLGYCLTKDYWFNRNRVTVGDAMALSGAALTPYYLKNRLLQTMMFIFNVRLGQWLPNPALGDVAKQQNKSRLKESPYEELGHVPTPLTVVTANLAIEQMRRPLCFISDGGHYENLGVWPLLQRRCCLIIASDAGEDPDRNFADLLKLIRLARQEGIEFHALTTAAENEESDVDLNPLRLSPDGVGWPAPYLRSLADRFSEKHYLMAKIKYPERQGEGPKEGYFLYLKASLTGDENSELIGFATGHGDFPQDPTADAIFDENQVESYRQLGCHIAEGVCRDMAREQSEEPEEYFWRKRTFDIESMAESMAKKLREDARRQQTEKILVSETVGQARDAKHPRQVVLNPVPRVREESQSSANGKNERGSGDSQGRAHRFSFRMAMPDAVEEGESNGHNVVQEFSEWADHLRRHVDQQ